MIDPPPGLRTARLGVADADEAISVWNECELHDIGETVFTTADWVVFAQIPSIDLERDAIGLRAGDELVAVGLVEDSRHAYVHVLPAWRGRGIGAWMLRWTQATGRAAGHT